jgi:hypothetical protein
MPANGGCKRPTSVLGGSKKRTCHCAEVSEMGIALFLVRQSWYCDNQALPSRQLLCHNAEAQLAEAEWIRTQDLMPATKCLFQ